MVPGLMARFNHSHHNLICAALQTLNASLLTQAGAFFGGGTLITLLHNEYRWSKDIDFVCAVGPGYRLLRERIMEHGVDVLFGSDARIAIISEYRADQYGIRFGIKLDDDAQTWLKVEVVAEARIQLEPPERVDWSPIPILSKVDRFAEKLLANADRWQDIAVKSRDLIDLCVLRLFDEIPAAAIEKAEKAYPVREPLRRAIWQFQSDPTFRANCFDRLQVHDRRHIIDGLDLLATDFGYTKTQRTIREAAAEDEVIEMHAMEDDDLHSSSSPSPD